VEWWNRLDKEAISIQLADKGLLEGKLDSTFQRIRLGEHSKSGDHSGSEHCPTLFPLVDSGDDYVQAL